VEREGNSSLYSVATIIVSVVSILLLATTVTLFWNFSNRKLALESRLADFISVLAQRRSAKYDQFVLKKVDEGEELSSFDQTLDGYINEIQQAAKADGWLAQWLWQTNFEDDITAMTVQLKVYRQIEAKSKLDFSALEEDDDIFDAIIEISDQSRAEVAQVAQQSLAIARLSTVFVSILAIAIVVNILLRLQKSQQASLLAQSQRQGAERFAALVNASKSMIVAIDDSGIIKMVNPTAQNTFGLQVGTSIFDQLEAKYHIDFRDKMNQSAQEEQDGLSIRLRNSEQHLLEMEIKMVNLLKDPAMAAIVIEGVDLTDRFAAIEADQRNKAKNEFLSRMSHELRTPLNAILGFSQLLEFESLPAQPKEFNGYIIKSARHLTGLVNDILEITKIEAGKLEVSLEAVPLQQALSESLLISLPAAKDRQISIHVADFDQNIHVHADLKRLNQVFINLLSNAIKYNKVGGQVEIKIIRHSPNDSLGKISIVVEDTGIGIAKEKQSRLFIPFDRLGIESTGVEGSGIGLALVKQLLHLMSGSITCTSELGKGSIFTVQLNEAPRLYGSVKLPIDSVVHNKEKYTVLYIEDNISNLELMKAVFKQKNLNFLSAMQGRKGLEILKRHPVDLLLLDLNLPDISGHEVLLEVLQNPQTAQLPVFIVTADATERQQRILMAAGATAYFSKPFEIDDLIAKIDAVLAAKS
jgi:signal transduction histidine kinase/ActR/RegA family two-component response regulator